ncbi:MAG: IPTL-CTERM sorting domain-containing protein, partial [Deltaproteobacteria bacterium]|nr:IPTL-CTERM sorting domain-containing protein [Deltaproteobacteria bacterium]
DADTKLVQFTAGGHVLGFQEDRLYMATGSHALRISFGGTAGVLPISDSGPSDPNKAMPLIRVEYRDLWEGITVIYESTPGGVVKSTYRLAPNARVRDIRLEYSVPVGLSDGGSLRVVFRTGILTESAPVAWQEIGGRRVPVPVSFRILGQREAGFTVGDYDPLLPLIIDPTMEWNTFMGSSATDYGSAIAVDSSGNVIVAGYSDATWGSPVNAHAGGIDALIAKLNSSGVRQWNTFMGSASIDFAQGVAVDSGGNVVVAGNSDSTWGSPVNAHTGGTDAFVAKLDSSGIRQWHTFMGSVATSGDAVSVDTSGNVFVAGTGNATWGSPVNAFAGVRDAFVAKLNSSGVQQWHTFMGSGMNEWGLAVAADTAGNVVVAGWSQATWGAPVNAHAGFIDAFAAKLDSSGNRLWNTFMGSGAIDLCASVAVDPSGNVVMAGRSDATWGTPVSAHTGGADAFVAKLNSSGTRLWNTFMGSGAIEVGEGVALDTSGNIVVAGRSDATWGTPVSAHAGGIDAFVAKLNSSGTRLWHTFMGSASGDFAEGVAVDTGGNVVVAGWSQATWGTPVNAFAGGIDAFAAKIGSAGITSVTSASADGIYGIGAGIDVTVNFTEPATLSGGNLTVNLDTGGAATISPFGPAASASGTYTVTIGESSPDLDSSSPLVLDGGATLRDAGSSDVTLTIPAGQSLADSKALVIDGIAPGIANVTSTSADGTYGVGDVIDVTVSFTEPLTLSGGNLTVNLDTGGSATITPFGPAASASGTYTVAPGENSPDLDSNSPLVLEGGATLRDPANNDAALTIPPGQSLADSKAIAVIGPLVLGEIPTLSEWGMALFVGLILMASFGLIKRRNARGA